MFKKWIIDSHMRKLSISFKIILKEMYTNPIIKNSIISSISQQICIVENENVISYYDSKKYQKPADVVFMNSTSINAA